ncbi:MAG: DUF6054 family protein [Lachnospiraceae bacterium]|nr:DUF6054 family protein [Lachnospiraceae bacterium]
MARYEKMVSGNFDTILRQMEQAVMEGSLSASFEDGVDYTVEDFRCAVRIFERYSWTGGNRVSLTLTLTGQDDLYLLSAITSGGSQGMFFKLNTWGENAFLDTIREAADDL